MEVDVIRDLGVALGLGLLVGLQREWSRNQLAGIRTFALITVLGALCGLVGDGMTRGLVIAGGLLSVTVLFAIGNRIRRASETNHPGMTTEVAGLVMFLVGAVVTLGYPAAAAVSTGAVATLLHWKAPLHRLVERMGEADVRAVLRMAIIGLVILPIMPNQAYGPYGVLNPFSIWLMVVLIVGISMMAYVAHRLVGARAGTLLAGLLGGLISSTATTVSYARRSRRDAAQSTAAAVVIMIASTAVFARVLVEVAVVAPSVLGRIAVPLVVMMVLMTIISGVAFLTSRTAIDTPEVGAPPSDLTVAVIFGVLYAAVLFGVAAVRERFGEPGIYVVAALSGLTDMDAITLSSAQLMKAGSIEASTGWRLIVTGALANLSFKLIAVACLGHRRLLGRLLVLFGLSLLGGGLMLRFWPT